MANLKLPDHFRDLYSSFEESMPANHRSQVLDEVISAVQNNTMNGVQNLDAFFAALLQDVALPKTNRR